MNSQSRALIITALFCAAPLLAQKQASTPAPEPATRAARGAPSGPKTVGDYSSDIIVVRDAQEQALEQVRDIRERLQDARAPLALETAVKEMERSLAMLEEAKKSPERLSSALAAEQAAYQALLKLAAREYRVSRSRNGQAGGQQGERAMRQLDQLDLKQSENRYETQRQAEPQQNAQQREQLQVLNRLKELAQRQQDLNERIKELQTALQEAKTEAEREEFRRRLKRLREEEREMLADVDELRQRMERSENQSRMSDARQQLDKTRSDVQRAAEALDNESVPQALSSGTRAQRELQQLSDDFRKKTSSQFADQMRQMRNDARQLAQKQDELAKQLDALADAKRKTLNDSDERKELAAQWARQKSGVTNLFNEMRGVSEQSETAEPLLSKRELETLSQQLEKEIAQNDTNAAPAGALASADASTPQRHGADAPENSAQPSAPAAGDEPNPTSHRGAPRSLAEQGERALNSQSQNGESASGQETAQNGSQQNGQAASSEAASNTSRDQAGRRNVGAGNGRRNFYEGGAEGGAEGGGSAGGAFRPLTGDDFVDWSDRLRDVEEMLYRPELRTEVARIRDRARAVRLEYKRRGQKPDWAVVRLQIATPLAEVRSRLGEELARRESNEAVVPLDRDPVPTKFSELVRRYYEQLGKSE